MLVSATSSHPGFTVAQLDQLADEKLRLYNRVELLRRQLYVLNPGSLKEVLGKHHFETEEIDAVEGSKVLAILPLVHKISVAFRSVGATAATFALRLDEACNSLCPRLPQEPKLEKKALAEDIEQFRSVVRSLTDGMLTCYPLNSYRVLRMLLFASIERCIFHEKADNKHHAITFPIGNSPALSLLEMIEYYKDALAKSFLMVDIALGVNLPSDTEDNFKYMITFFERYKDAIAHFPEKQKTVNELTKIIEMLKILEIAIKHPCTHLPILLTPLQNLPIAAHSGHDIQTLNPKTESWLNDFTLAFKVQSDLGLAVLLKHLKDHKLHKKNQKAYEVLTASIKELQERTTAVTSTISLALKALQKYENLSAEDQKRKASDLSKIQVLILKFQTELDQMDKQYASTIKHSTSIFNLFNNIRTKEGNLLVKDFLIIRLNQAVQYPFNYYRNLSCFMLKSIDTGVRQFRSFHQNLEQVLPIQYSTLSHITLIDLIDFNLRRHYRAFKAKTQDDVDDQNAVMLNNDHLLEILNVMGKFHLLSQYSSVQHISADFENADHLNSLADLVKELPTLRTKIKDPTIIDFHKKVCDLLYPVLLTRQWPKMFIKSPFSKDKEHLKLEKQFYYELYECMESRILEFKGDNISALFEAFFIILKNAKIDPLPFENLCRDFSTKIEKLQKKVKLEKASVENFEERAGKFWEDIAEAGLSLDKICDSLTLLIYDQTMLNPEALAPLVNSQNFMMEIQRLFDLNFRSSVSHSVNSFLERSAWIKDEQSKTIPLRIISHKRRTFVPKKVDGVSLPIVKPLPAKPSADKFEKDLTLEEKFQTFQKSIAALSHYCLAFEVAQKTPTQIRLNELQQTAASHLIKSMPALKELFNNIKSYGHHPFFIHALYLHLSVAMEQLGILTAANLNVYIEPEDKEHALLKRMGRECFLHKHHPLNYGKLIERNHLLAQKHLEKKELLFNAEQRVLMDKLSRVIGVSGRNPSSGNDELSLLLDQALRTPEDVGRCEMMEKKLRLSLETCQNFLKAIFREAPQVVPEVSLTQTEMSDCLNLLQSRPKVSPRWREEAQVFIQSFKARISGLKDYLSYPLNRFVPAIDEYDASFNQRKGTIFGSLNDMQINLDLVENILSLPEDPTLCLTHTEGALLHPAALLEEAELVVLSHLPVKATTAPSTHYLWEEKNGKPIRYWHDISDYAIKVQASLKTAKIQRDEVFYQDLTEFSNALATYLKTSFRYYQPSNCPTTKLRDHCKSLSILRDRLIRGVISHAEEAELDKHLKISHPDQRLEKLDQYIADVLVLRIKQPAIQVLKVADSLLQAYEELLDT